MTTNDKKPSLLDYPEPSEDFNNKLTEKEIAKHPNQIKNVRPIKTEWFRVYDPSGCGDVSKITKRIIIELPVKGESKAFVCFGSEEFYEEIKPKPQHCNKHNRYRKNCLSCREAIA